LYSVAFTVSHIHHTDSCCGAAQAVDWVRVVGGCSLCWVRSGGCGTAARVCCGGDCTWTPVCSAEWVSTGDAFPLMRWAWGFAWLLVTREELVPELFKLGVPRAPASCAEIVEKSGLFYTSGVLFFRTSNSNREYLKERKMSKRMRNPVRSWEMCVYWNSGCLQLLGEVWTVTVETGRRGVVDNSLTTAFKESLSCEILVLCWEPKALFLGWCKGWLIR